MRTKKDAYMEWNDIDVVFCKALKYRNDHKILMSDVIARTEERGSVAIPYYYLNKCIRKFIAAGFIWKKDNYYLIDEYFDIKIKSDELPLEPQFNWNERIQDYFKNYRLTKQKFESISKSIYTPAEYIEDYSYLEFLHEQFDTGTQLPMMYDYNVIALDGTSKDPTYGYSKDNPINVGGFKAMGNEMIENYFNSLIGYDGYEITYKKISSAKEFQTLNTKNRRGFIDKYAIYNQTSLEPVILYFNMYEYKKPLMAPVGFIQKPPYFLD